MRVLATIGFSFSAGVFLAALLPWNGWQLYAAGGVLLLALAWLFAARKQKYFRRGLLILLPLAVSLAYFAGYDHLVRQPIEDRCGAASDFAATVCDWPQATERGARVTVELEGYHRARAVLYGEAELLAARPGDTVTGTAQWQSAAHFDSDDVTHFNARGVYALLYGREDVRLSAGDGDALRWLPQRAGKAFREKVAAIWDDARVSGFLTAELTGDKSAMDDGDYLAMQETGLAHLFAVSGLICWCGISQVISNSVSSAFQNAFHIPPLTTTLVLTALAALIVLRKNATVKSLDVIVPIMAVCYFVMTVIIIAVNFRQLPAVLGRIFSEAFGLRQVAAGGFGAVLMNGIKRGLYSNEAGIGSAPNAAASADVSHPAKQGLVQMLSVFIDTILICSSTAFMILCTNLDASAYVDAAGNTMNAAYIQDSLVANFGPAGSVFITVALTLFAFTTLVGNYFYAEMNISYLYPKATKNKPFMLFYRLLAAVIIFMGAQFSAGLAWDLADVLMGIMALINVPSCLIMGKTACKALADYRKQKSEGKNPMFHAADIGLSGTDYWIETE